MSPIVQTAPSPLVEQLTAYGLRLQEQNPSNGFLPVLQEAVDQLCLLTLLAEVVRREVGLEKLIDMVNEVNEPVRATFGADAPQLHLAPGEVPEEETKR